MRQEENRSTTLPRKACASSSRQYKNDKKRLGIFHIYFYALNKDGAPGARLPWRNAPRTTRSGPKRAMDAVHEAPTKPD